MQTVRLASTSPEHSFGSETYLSVIQSYKQQKTITRLRWTIMRTALVMGRRCHILYSDRICSCGKNETDDLNHFLWSCMFFEEIRTKWISPLMGRTKYWANEEKTIWLLSNTLEPAIYSLGIFVLLVQRIRAKIKYGFPVLFYHSLLHFTSSFRSLYIVLF